jgi:GntR family transcriptional regulator of arabinose operon
MASGKRPLYEVIFSDFQKRILSGDIEPGTKLPTEMELSAMYSVSRITATRALKELELHGLIHRIKGSGSYVNQPGTSTQKRRRWPDGHLSLISLVVPFNADISFDIFKGIEDVAMNHDYFVTFHNSGEDAVEEKRLVEDIIARGSHGVIIYPAARSNNQDLYSSLLIDKYPFVLIDHRVQGLETSLVWGDNFEGFRSVTAHLLNEGHRRIILVGTDIYGISSETERYRGFCQAHLDAGVPLLRKHMYDLHDAPDNPSIESADDSTLSGAVEYLFDILGDIPEDSRPTGIAAVNDATAQRIISVAVRRGISIPQDYSVTGFDNLPWSAGLNVPLTTVDQPMAEMGRKAARELFRRIADPSGTVRCETVRSRLVIRQSTAPPGKPGSTGNNP